MVDRRGVASPDKGESRATVSERRSLSAERGGGAAEAITPRKNVAVLGVAALLSQVAAL
jgi:hypothetical protein